jgi:hypothetical protein
VQFAAENQKRLAVHDQLADAMPRFEMRRGIFGGGGRKCEGAERERGEEHFVFHKPDYGDLYK